MRPPFILFPTFCSSFNSSLSLLSLCSGHMPSKLHQMEPRTQCLWTLQELFSACPGIIWITSTQPGSYSASSMNPSRLPHAHALKSRRAALIASYTLPHSGSYCISSWLLTLLASPLDPGFTRTRAMTSLLICPTLMHQSEKSVGGNPQVLVKWVNPNGIRYKGHRVPVSVYAFTIWSKYCRKQYMIISCCLKELLPCYTISPPPQIQSLAKFKSIWPYFFQPW